MDNKAEYYQLKGLLSEMPADKQAEVEQAMQEVIDIATRSDTALLGATIAMAKLSMEL